MARTKKASNATRTSSSAKKASTKKTATSKKSRGTKASASRGESSQKSTAAEAEVPVDRRDQNRRQGDRRKVNEPVAVERRKLERRKKVNRRRQIDPTTCERDYSEDEIEFMNALDDYKRRSGRMFPTCSEILEVLRELGYAKTQRREQSAEPAEAEPAEAVPAEHAAEPTDPGAPAMKAESGEIAGALPGSEEAASRCDPIENEADSILKREA